jgi:hypothetical protein
MISTIARPLESSLDYMSSSERFSTIPTEEILREERLTQQRKAEDFINRRRYR